MPTPWRRRLLGWAAALAAIALLAQTAVVLRSQRGEPDAAVVLEGNPERIRAAAQLAKARPALPIYISSEPVFHQVYLDTLAEEQVPIERFALRTCATDTLTNFTCILGELKAKGHRHLYVVTSAHHMARALTVGRMVLGRHGMAATPLPVPGGRESAEPWIRVARDALRALLWAVTGFTGTELVNKPKDAAAAQ